MAYPVPASDPTSVFGRRVLAVLIDAILIWIPVSAVASADFEYVKVETLEAADSAGDDFCDDRIDRGEICADLTEIDGIEAVYYSEGWSARTQLIFWALPFALFVVVQAFTGWTVGKLVTGIRVVREDGRPPGFVKALLRWLLWIVDGFPYVIPGLVGFITGLTTVGHRRVGDMAAKTFVVRKGAVGSPVVVPGLTRPADGAATGWGVPGPPATPPSWTPASDPSSPGWSSPVPPPPVGTPPPPPPAEGPQWDEARSTYIQWDPDQRAWMQWDDRSKTWSRIPGQ